MPANAIALIEGPNFTAYSVDAIDSFLRVKMNSATRVNDNPSVAVCGAKDPCLGITQHPIAAAGRGNCRCENASGTQIYRASGAITAGVPIYADAGGKVTSTADDNAYIGVSLSAAAADGDLIEAQVCFFVPTPNV